MTGLIYLIGIADHALHCVHCWSSSSGIARPQGRTLADAFSPGGCWPKAERPAGALSPLDRPGPEICSARHAAQNSRPICTGRRWAASGWAGTRCSSSPCRSRR